MPASDDHTPNTLAAAIEVYLADIDRSSSPHMSAAYQQALKLFTDVLIKQCKVKPTTTPISELGVGWAQSYLEYLQAERAVETEHLYSRAVLNFYETVEKSGWAEVDASELAEYLREHRRPKEHHIPDPPVDAIATIIQHAATSPVPVGEDSNERDRLRIMRDKAFVLTLADTGLKVSEICDLRRESVNNETGKLQYDGVTIALSSEALRAINGYLSARQQLDSQQKLKPDTAKLPLFARHDKRASDNILPVSRWTASNIVNEWVKLAIPEEERQELQKKGQTISPQTFRHYFVLKMLEQTGDLTVTQTLARHTDPSTTRRYMQYLDENGTEGSTPDTDSENHQ